MPHLVIKKPLGPVVEVPLVEEAYSLGRAADNAIVLEGSLVSRRHGQLRREGGRFHISDLGSHNGIFVNGQKIQQACLRDNDEIRIGNYVLIYREAEAGEVGAAHRPPETVTVEEDFDRLVTQIRRPGQAAAVRTETSLLRQFEKERRTLALLCELSRALSTVYSLEDVGRQAIGILLETTQAERGAVFVLEPEQNLRPAVVCQRPGIGELPGQVALSSTVARRILAERKGIITADAAGDPRFAHGESVLMHGLRSIACAPLVGQAGNLGILYLENNRSIGAFSHEDLELLCAVASQVGLSVENARMFDQLRRANEELERRIEERTAELRASELKRFQAEKIASLSRLVAGVAHEINNPLGALKANLEVVMVMAGRLATAEDRSPKEAVMTDQLLKIARESVAACGRILGVVRSLRAFARLDESEFKMASVNDGLAAAVQLLDPAVRKRIEVRLDLGDVPAIPCYPALLNEAFMNLLTNACQAIRQQGEISISTRREEGDVVVCIRDTGCGIPPHHLEKIFDPGFTTKGVGVGVGLGLPTAFRVLKEHQGTIQVTSEVGKGSTFTVRLPIRLPSNTR